MTDKELRKLSRLELLELLLKETKENEKLRSELKRFQAEAGLEKTSEQLKETADRMGMSLQSFSALSDVIEKLIPLTGKVQSEPTVRKRKNNTADVDIYKRLLLFFARTPDSLSVLPEELQKDVARRLAEIIDSI